MNRKLWNKGVLALVLSLPVSTAFGDGFSFAAIGDQPYSPTITDSTGTHQLYPAPAYERVIANINASAARFTVHVGDIKAGNTLCENGVYAQNLTYFNSFSRAVIFVPGDNEWTDCHRTNNGHYDPQERLSYLRSVFYPTNKSLGVEKMTLTRQAGYPENTRWTFGAALFVTINQPGSNNNHQRNVSASVPPPTDDNETEYTNRNAANIAWLQAAFAAANASSDIKGVVIISQANPFERFLESGQGYTESGYANFVTTIRTFAQTSTKRLLYIGGDTHYFRMDKPLTSDYPSPTQLVPSTTGTRIYSFTRTEVFAQNDAHWTLITVDPKYNDLFSFTPMIVPGN